MFCRLFLVGFAISLSLNGCANRPAQETSLKTSYAPAPPEPRVLKASDPVSMEPRQWTRHARGEQLPEAMPTHALTPSPHHLAGRTLMVASLHDIALEDKEVVLTFDDGPAPGRTERILATLDEFGVKATFMMVGEMAQAHPATAHKVFENGETIGSHTFRHPDLVAMNFDAAIAEIVHGESAVSKVVGTDVSFFRFPYLADNSRLRAAVEQRNLVIMDVDIDSRDYLNTNPETIVERTMERLRKRGRGIILLHDIHQRTAVMLPTLLSRLEEEGYKVVRLEYLRSRAPTVAQADIKIAR
jgi:peptidoglycan/xylan/chitin deacetylase (PgdA/CDA1 family)